MARPYRELLGHCRLVLGLLDAGTPTRAQKSAWTSVLGGALVALMVLVFGADQSNGVVSEDISEASLTLRYSTDSICCV